MSQIITNPDSMISFSRTMMECSEQLKKEEQHLFGELTRLGATWKDPRYQKFDRAITEAARELVLFHTATHRYAEYLVRKASAARKIMNS
jgi:uncharacterized protein YukE